MEPLLCVITINYNSADHTIEMVRSLRESDYDNLQILVVDNCSEENDYSKLVAANLEAKCIQAENNLGFSGGNNIGLRYAMEQGAKYAMLLNNDTTIAPDAIKTMVQCIENGEADAVCPKILGYYDHDEISYAGGDLVGYKGAVRIDGIGQPDDGKFDQKKPITFASGCCILMKMDTWQEVGMMEEKYFLYFEDTALSAKLVHKGKTILYLPEAVVYHKESVSTKKYSDNYQYYFCRNRLLYISENLSFPMQPLAYGYTGMYMLKHLVNGNFSVGNVRAAIKDFMQGRFGKRQ